MVQTLLSAASSPLPPGFQAAAIDALQKELTFWNSGKKLVTVVDKTGKAHTLSRYWADWTSPRPESFKCDPRSFLVTHWTGFKGGTHSTLVTHSSFASRTMRVSRAFLLRVYIAVLLERTEPVEMPCLRCNTHTQAAPLNSDNDEVGSQVSIVTNETTQQRR